MDQSEKDLLSQAEELFKNKKYQDIIYLLTDDVLEKYNNVDLYVHKARAFDNLNKLEDCLIIIQKAIIVGPYSSWAFLTRGNLWNKKKDYDKAIEDYSKAIEISANYSVAYNNRGIAWSSKEDYDKAIDDYNKGIELDGNYPIVYNSRGNAWSKKKDYDKAIEDYTKSIELDENFALPYSNRGNKWYLKKDYDKAIEDYNKAIELDENYSTAYYNRGKTYNALGEYTKAISDYLHYIELENNADDYLTKVALSEIERLKENIENEWYKKIEQIVLEIKQLLIFDKRCITHYTGLSAASAMILGNSPFRLSEGAYLNDTSEGKELFKYLSFETPKSAKDGTIEEDFSEKPFIGSFVADNKHNDLTLWRMYGKEAQVEAKGCALTINKEQFINNFEAILNPLDSKESISPQNEGKFTFYKVAYKNNEEFLIPGSNKKDIKRLKDILQSLKDNVKELKKDQREKIAALLNDIAYLFKSAEYQYEYEIRLVVQGVGIKKEFDIITEKEINVKPPRVYINMIKIAPVLEKITLGPKVEKADEWAAAFNYSIQENYNKKVEIVISHLPFK